MIVLLAFYLFFERVFQKSKLYSVNDLHCFIYSQKQCSNFRRAGAIFYFPEALLVKNCQSTCQACVIIFGKNTALL